MIKEKELNKLFQKAESIIKIPIDDSDEYSNEFVIKNFNLAIKCQCCNEIIQANEYVSCCLCDGEAMDISCWDCDDQYVKEESDNADEYANHIKQCMTAFRRLKNLKEVE